MFTSALKNVYSKHVLTFTLVVRPHLYELGYNPLLELPLRENFSLTSSKIQLTVYMRAEGVLRKRWEEKTSYLSLSFPSAYLLTELVVVISLSAKGVLRKRWEEKTSYLSLSFPSAHSLRELVVVISLSARMTEKGKLSV